MKLTKILGATAVAALALMAFAGTASATTLETNGVIQTGSITLEASLTTGTSVLLKNTSGDIFNTCASSTVEGKTSVFTGTTVSGPTSTMSFSNCTHEKVVVHKAGTLSVERIGATTNGTVRSSGIEVTVPGTIFDPETVTLTCTTVNTDLGPLTGVGAGGTAEVDVKAVLNCGFFVPSAILEGTYVLTLPGTKEEKKHAIGVVG
jgi:hypothetical protein